jgi:hypothetical protein
LDLTQGELADAAMLGRLKTRQQNTLSLGRERVEHLIVTAERKFWRCIESGEPPHLFGVERLNPRLRVLVKAEISEFLQNRLFGVLVITEPLMSKLVFIINTEDEWSRFSANAPKQVSQSVTVGRIENVCFSAAIAAYFRAAISSTINSSTVP